TLGLLKELRRERRLLWGAVVSSWFWLIGVVALSLSQLLVKSALGADEHVVTAFLAIFTISIAIGSGLAAWLAHGGIVLSPTLIAAFVLAVCALDLGWATYGLPKAPLAGIGQVFSSGLGLRAAIDLAGLAIGGGLFIVPVFSAVQIWAGADKRARVIAAVNVLNAGFMAGGSLAVAQMQVFGVTVPEIFLGIGVANFLVMVVIARTMPTNLLRDFLTVLFRTLFRLEVVGLEN